jgi:hypothetical protein
LVFVAVDCTVVVVVQGGALLLDSAVVVVVVSAAVAGVVWAVVFAFAVAAEEELGRDVAKQQDDSAPTDWVAAQQLAVVDTSS